MRTRTVRRRHLPIMIVAGLVLLAAACGASRTETTSVASLATDDDAANGSTSDDLLEVEAPEDPDEAFAAYEECMEAEGIDFGGSIASYSVVDGLEVDGHARGVTIEGSAEGDDPQQPSLDLEDFDFEASQEAMEKCSPLLANAGGGYELSPEERAAFDDAQLVFADCMEEQGIEVPDFSGATVTSAIGVASGSIELHPPDPQGDVDFVSPDFDFEAFTDAASECQHAFDDLDRSYGDGSGQ
ncbi:MAG: hypothetical protein GY708_09955 [Actinomycetia bacterium]|nr:hypothetical protein [Actinomycetes bacterium]